jgi:hypothetical protein
MALIAGAVCAAALLPALWLRHREAQALMPG